MIPLLDVLAVVILGAPAFALLLLVVAHLALGEGMAERRIQQVTAASFAVGLLGALALAALLALGDVPRVVVALGSLLSLRGYQFDLAMELRATTLLLLTLTFVLAGLVGVYSARYLHRDEGFFRFYLLLVVFAIGMERIATARSLTLLFAGWELVGLTSALLIAFYFRRPGPTRHGLRAYATYRATDVGLLLAVAILEHQGHTADFDRMAAVPLTEPWLATVAGLLILGAMGKGAVMPLSGWLPKAMEGPTPSSAIFYGALSVHASPYLLLRASPLLDRVPFAAPVIVGLGAFTALHATLVGRTRPDIKTALGYASVAQVGLIWVEVGLGWHKLALAHIVGHAALRTWHLLRSPSVLSERAMMRLRTGRESWWSALGVERLMPQGARNWLYRVSLEGWYLDQAGRVLILNPLLALLHRLDAVDARWRDWLGAEDRVGLGPMPTVQADESLARQTIGVPATRGP